MFELTPSSPIRSRESALTAAFGRLAQLNSWIHADRLEKIVRLIEEEARFSAGEGEEAAIMSLLVDAKTLAANVRSA